MENDTEIISDYCCVAFIALMAHIITTVHIGSSPNWQVTNWVNVSGIWYRFYIVITLTLISPRVGFSMDNIKV